MEKVSFARADWPQKMQYQNEYDNFARLYGMRLVEYAEGYACVEMQMRPDFLNSQLRLHGSWQAALILIAAGKAAQSSGQAVRPCKLNMNYHHGVREGVLRVIARQKFAADNWLTIDVELHCLGDHSVNGDHASGRAAADATPADILVASGRVDFLPLGYELTFPASPRAEFFPAERRAARPRPVYPESRAGLYDDVPGLRPCFKQADWPTKQAYMNENENMYYSEGIRVTEYGPGHCCAEMDVWAQHVDAEGLLAPAWLAIFLDPLIGKPALHAGNFCVTAQTSITFFEPRAALGGRLHGQADRVSQEEAGHFAVYSGSVYDENNQELACGVCTMYLRDTEINFRRELPLNMAAE